MTKNLSSHLAIQLKNKTRFDFLKTYLTTREKPNVTQDELLEDMMNVYEKNKTHELATSRTKTA